MRASSPLQVCDEQLQRAFDNQRRIATWDRVSQQILGTAQVVMRFRGDCDLDAIPCRCERGDDGRAQRRGCRDDRGWLAIATQFQVVTRRNIASVVTLCRVLWAGRSHGRGQLPHIRRYRWQWTERGDHAFHVALALVTGHSRAESDGCRRSDAARAGR